MTHNTKNSLIIIGLLALAVAVEIFLITRTGFRTPTTKTSQTGGEPTSETFFFQSDRIARLQAAVTSCDLKVSVWDEGRIEIIITSNRAQRDRPYAILQDDAVIISEDEQEISSKDKTSLDIKMPKNLAGEFNNFIMSLKTTSGAISAQQFSCSSFAATTTSGRIMIDGASFTTAEFATESGAVICSDATAAKVSATAKDGAVRYTGTCNRIFIKTQAGAIQYSATEMVQEALFESESGSINITLPENDGYALSYAAQNGRLKDAFTNTNAKGNGNIIYKNGAALVDVKTSDGNINISKAK
ncbi:MAG: DUF4097 family beta strand repeat protein [Treponema sp.]|nr:DUF4097 family beta strand repeat protein [Treponema sp.]